MSLQSSHILTKSAEDLADLMKTLTRAHHRKAERTGIINDILRQSADRNDYILYMRNLHVIYSALETLPAKAPKSFDKVTPFLPANLKRAEAIKQDLTVMSGSTHWTTLPILKSCALYRDHIELLAGESPLALLGHIYVRYLGDLNGGQVLEKLIKKSLAIDHSALNFYRFSSIENIVGFRADYREQFNALKLPRSDKDKVAATAIKAFEFNIALSEEVSSLATRRE